MYPYSEISKPTLGLAHPASYSKEAGNFFLGVERLGCEADNSLPSRAEEAFMACSLTESP
jgi:hypothetical protein